MMVLPAGCCLMVIQPHFSQERLVQNAYKFYEFHYQGQESSVYLFNLFF